MSQAGSVFDNPAFDGHEQVIFCRDVASDLKAIIAIHSTRRGPAAGGCRMYPYATVDDALVDVLRLSRGMSYKNALAGLALGGGKAVIIADPHAPAKPKLLRAFARHVQTLNGRYWTAIDVGVGVEDVALIARDTDYAFCLVDERAGRLNPAVFTALGGFVSLHAVADYLGLGPAGLKGVRVAVQGLGQTGMDLCRRLTEAGATVIATDVDDAVLAEAHNRYGAKMVAPDAIYAAEADIFAPCAMGAILNDVTIPQLKVRAVCGLANNQLGEPRHAEALRARGILYAPDYVVNAGGVIYGADDIFKSHDTKESEARVRAIGDMLTQIFDTAASSGRTTAEVADALARDRMAGPWPG